VTLKSLAGKKVRRVEMLGLREAIQWNQTSAGLVITIPAKRPCKYAYTFRITSESL
jgi:alpha-L-fucosidase